jgi:two-component system chemotaxis response regulator CheY
MARAIIADDSKFMRRIIRETLEQGGHEIVAEAENGYEAVDLYKSERPDFVTMDITMWGKDGLKAVSDIVDIDPDARVIVISALNENTLRLSQSEIRAKGFLTKPFEKEQLLELVQSIL